MALVATVLRGDLHVGAEHSSAEVSEWASYGMLTAEYARKIVEE